MVFADYLRSVRANKALLAGYVFLGATPFIPESMPLSQARFAMIECAAIGGYLLGATLGGSGTWSTVRTVRQHIKETGTLDDGFQENFRTYCAATGVVAAARAEGVEHLVSDYVAHRAAHLPVKHYAPGVAFFAVAMPVLAYIAQEFVK